MCEVVIGGSSCCERLRDNAGTESHLQVSAKTWQHNVWENFLYHILRHPIEGKIDLNEMQLPEIWSDRCHDSNNWKMYKVHNSTHEYFSMSLFSHKYVVLLTLLRNATRYLNWSCLESKHINTEQKWKWGKLLKTFCFVCLEVEPSFLYKGWQLVCQLTKT